jgi:hypothetical protein
MSTSQQHYRCRNLLRLRLAGGKELVYSPRTGASAVIPAGLAAVLAACRSFRTLEDHAREQAGPHRIEPDSLRSFLRIMTRKGLLESSERAVHAASRRGRHDQNPPLIDTIGIVTHERSGTLSRAVRSYAANGHRHGRVRRFVVMDDSRGHIARRNRALLAALAGDVEGEIRHAGGDEKRAFLDRLENDYGLDRALLEFAFLDPYRSGRAIGANRNCLLLETAGSMVFAADDDSVCDVVGPPIADRPASIGVNPGEEWWFFKDREEACGAVVRVEVDLVGAHESLLGRSPASCHALTSDGASLLDLEETGLDVVDRALAVNGRILITANGLWGDHGMPSSASLALLRGSSRDRLLATQARYRNAVSSRQVLRISPSPSVCHPVRSWTGMVGLDNRDLLPPFLPLGSGEDNVFCLTMSRSMAGAWQGLVPLAALHSPVVPRASSPESVWRNLGAPSLWELVGVAIISFDGWPTGSPAATLRGLGAHLHQVGELDPRRFDEFVRSSLWQHWGAWSGALRQAAREYGAQPRFWMRDVERQWKELARNLSQDDASIPNDVFLRRLDPAAASRRTRTIFRQMGRLLEEWPRMVVASRDLVNAGHGLTTVVRPARRR